MAERRKVVNTDALLALNPDFEKAVWNGEPWAVERMRLAESLNNGEPEGMRRPFDGKPRKWCGAACSAPEGCITCTLPENPELVQMLRKMDNER